MAKVKKLVKYVQPTAQEKKLWAALIEQADEINKLKDAICPRVAARLTTLERRSDALTDYLDKTNFPTPGSLIDRIRKLEQAVAPKPAPQQDGVAIKYALLLQAVDAVFASVNGSAGPHHARVQLRALDALSHIRKQL